MASSFVMGTLNSFMACGELPTLFTNDEMDGLLQVRLSLTVHTDQCTHVAMPTSVVLC